MTYSGILSRGVVIVVVVVAYGTDQMTN